MVNKKLIAGSCDIEKESITKLCAMLLHLFIIFLSLPNTVEMRKTIPLIITVK